MMTTITLTIDGMSCEGCVKSVQNALLTVTGVTQATVTLSPAVATVSYHDTYTNTATIVSAIEDAGFDVVECS